ncbi:MAG: TetR/AcrR family transcriptional regulator [Desulfatitalea sp.]|nr:TetR/AcrR family transcriptional regulator [Desulfatitalea sp.]NNK01056.1 TetR/AcrR family transcriptional regulator [Desulfatitalea sp.]
MTRKEAILQAATIMFSQSGYKDTSTAEIAKMTGVAEGTIFYHFKNKEKLFLAVLEQTRALIIDEFNSFMSHRQFSSGMEAIETAVSFYMYLSGKFENAFLLLHRYFPYKMAVSVPGCRQHLEAIYDCLVDIFEEAVTAGQKDGSIASMPPRKTALIIFTMVDGVVRFKTYNLYDASALYGDIIESCKKMLRPEQTAEAYF